MTENAKTLTFVGIGVAVVVVALLSQPSSADLDVKSQVGEILTKKFTSPSQAKRLRIVRVDEKTATRSTFDVAEKNGLWTMPSKDGYPADATRQMAEAATGLMDRKILGVASENAGDHALYGVVDPLGNVQVGQKGVGTRVTISDAQDQALVDLIIGNEVKDSQGKHYVRVAEQALVYVLDVNPSHLSTKFEDWIEKDLLKLTAYDLQQVEIKDYSAQLAMMRGPDGMPEIVPTWDPRAEMTIAFDEKDSKWNPVRLRAFDTAKRDYADFQLADDEELNGTSLNGMKSALDDLKIVDVARKPAGLSADLKAGEDFMTNREALQDLRSRGFTAIATAPGGPREIICSDGEVIATMKNGTEYVLRFGKLVDVDEEGADPAAKADPTNPAAGKGIHRYLFAMVRFNEAAVKRPELQQPPELPPTEPGMSGEFRPAPGAAPANAGGDAKEADKKQDQPPQVIEEAAPPQDAGKAQEKEAAKQDAGEKTAAAAPDQKGEPAANKEQTEKDTPLAKIIAERKRIEAENQRKLDEYQATLEKGRENVKNLNLRFGDWYFVVDNEVFTKIRLGRDAVIKKKVMKADADAKKENESILGLPGSMIEGLPNLLRGGGEKGK